MKLNISIEVPDDERYDLLKPRSIEVILDYGKKELHTNGKISKDEQSQDVITDRTQGV